MEEKKRNNNLRGRENYLAWKNRIEGILLSDDILEVKKVQRNGVDVETIDIMGEDEATRTKNKKKAKKILLESLDDRVMHVISSTESFKEMMKSLNAAYGFAHIDPSQIKKDLRSIRLFPNKNPATTFDFMDRKINELDAAGGSVSDKELVEYLHDSLSGDIQRNSFWFILKGNMSTIGLQNYTYQSAKEAIQKYWNNYKIPIQERASIARN